MTPSDRARISLPALAIMTLLTLTLPTVVLADAELEQSTPAVGATVPSPFDGPIVMTFSAALADGSTAELRDPDGGTIGSVTVDGPSATMTITLDSALAAGTDKVRWVAVAEDTHLNRDTFEFTVAPAPPTPQPTPDATPTPAASAPATPATSPSATPGPTVAPTPLPTVDDDTAGVSDVFLPILVVLIVAGAGAVYLLTRRNRPAQPG